jgi:hypothetical protein
VGSAESHEKFSRVNYAVSAKLILTIVWMGFSSYMS